MVATIIISSVLISGCSLPKTKNYNTSLAKCDNKDQVTKNPDLVYQKMLSCINDGNYSTATLFYAKAGTLTWYNSLKEPNETNRLYHQELAKNTIDQLSLAQKNHLSAMLEAIFSDSLTHEKICTEVTPPVTNTDNEFSSKLWLDAKRGYLHCK